ncbi:MAG: phage portal protein family protein [Pirellulaceae bacterium]
MSFFSRLRDAFLPRSSTATPKPTRVDPMPMDLAGLPPFNLHVADMMRYDPQVRIGLGARNGLLMSAEVEVTGEQSDMVRFVQAQWDRIWGTAGHQLLRAKLFGFQPFEVVYRLADRGKFAGLVEFQQLLDRPAGSVRLLVSGEEPVGFVLKQTNNMPSDLNGSPRHETQVLAPRALVATFDAECGNPYGCALLARAYPAWYEKWMESGVKQTMRLRMIKDAYIGDIFWYPPDRKVQTVDGKEVAWRDIARDIVESRMSGGALTLPLLRDKDGHKLIDYSPPQGVTGITSIFMWKKDVDLEIWKALEVPPEIIQASSSGSGFSGRWIPFVVALSACHMELAELIRCVDRDILRPLARLNFATEPRYDIRPKSLVDIYAKKFGARADRLPAPNDS